MLEYRFSIRHEGCWTENFNKRFPRVSASILFSHPYSEGSSTIIEVRNVGGERIDAIVEWLREHPVVVESELQQHAAEQRTALISLQTDYSETDTEPLMNVLKRHQCFPISSAEIMNGREHGTLLLASTEQMQALYEELSEYGPVSVKSLTELEITHSLSEITEITQVINDLSARQQEVLSLAIDEGYYDSPRRCSVSELAEMDDAGMSTVAEHLRLAEIKVLQAVRPLLENRQRTTVERPEPTAPQ